MSGEAKRNFLAAAGAQGDPEALTETFREALQAFGSNTEDNVAAAQRVVFKALQRDGGGTATALALNSTNASLADVLNAAEGTEIPDSVRDAFPELDQEDWDAVLRVATLVLIALEP
ncbi:hypothetical protein ETD83_30085 [Actinomadura soli]|uniref:Uncharacterized protein n=1 Tax=Actinomadura soli TaxID=2508997 RepID=A0A5C4J444_9ACTN|nr:hypothetical protein [Actinomadura soli]TMQ91628.1 hypothetical protein ETD83_30085 [Actinomadura soli]